MTELPYTRELPYLSNKKVKKQNTEFCFLVNLLSQLSGITCHLPSDRITPLVEKAKSGHTEVK